MAEQNKIRTLIKKDAIERAKIGGVSQSNLYIDDKIYKAGETINVRKQPIIVKQDSYMIFVDDDPLFNWSHYCRYFLYSSANGEFLERIEARFPPYMAEIPGTYHVFSQPITYPAELENTAPVIEPGPAPLNINSDGNRYALLFSGNSNYRHVNDLQYLYSMLVGRFNYPKENVYVLNYDGTWHYSCAPPITDIFPILNVPYDIVVNGPGTRSALNNVFDELKRKLKANDTLFIHTNNHGDGPLSSPRYEPINVIEASLCLYSNEGILDDYSSSEFGEKLAGLPKINNLMVLMEQCHSGGFQDYITRNSPAANTCFMAACKINQISMGGINFDPFTYAWTKSATGYILQKSLPFGLIYPLRNPSSAQYAFNIAFTTVINDSNNPVMAENPAGCGTGMHLGIPVNKKNEF